MAYLSAVVLAALCAAAIAGETKCPSPDGSLCSGHGLCEDHDLDGSHNCFCEPGYFGDACEKETCVTHCSEHGRCNIEDTKQCVCDDGWTGMHCGVSDCPGACSGHGVCGQNSTSPELRACFCVPGWKGDACSLRVCPMDVHFTECSGHGACKEGACECEPGYHGDNCGKVTCNIACVHGTCKCDASTGDCSCYCDEGFVGPMCDRRCPRNCSSRGKCDEWGRCVCKAGWTGIDCSQPSCPNDCSQHGVCHDNRTCSCEAGWTGVDCSRLECPDMCNWRTHNGECLFDRCVCYPGYSGPACEHVLEPVEEGRPCGEDCYDHCRSHSECDSSDHQQFVFHHTAYGTVQVAVPAMDSPLVDAEIEARTGTLQVNRQGRKCYLKCLSECFRDCFQAVHELSEEERAAAMDSVSSALATSEGIVPGGMRNITGDIAAAEESGVREGGISLQDVVDEIKREAAADEARS